MKNEIWKDIIGYENLYQISNYGNIKSINKGRFYNKNLKCQKNHKGYLTITLTKNNYRKNFKIHQLVAISFLNHTPCGMKKVIDHIDNNKLNNSVKNLQITDCHKNHYFVKNNIKKSKYKWIYYENNKWRVRIYTKDKRINLGVFDTEIEAIEKLKNHLNSAKHYHKQLNL